MHHLLKSLHVWKHLSSQDASFIFSLLNNYHCSHVFLFKHHTFATPFIACAMALFDLNVCKINKPITRSNNESEALYKIEWNLAYCWDRKSGELQETPKCKDENQHHTQPTSKANQGNQTQEQPIHLPNEVYNHKYL